MARFPCVYLYMLCPLLYVIELAERFADVFDFGVFLFEKRKKKKDTVTTDLLQFTVNGKPYSVSNPEIGTSLNTWLRADAKLTGSKAMCKEGGCGSCVVMVTRPDAITGKNTHIGVNSCLFPLLSVDGCHVTTTEGLVQDGGKYNEIQERVAHFNGTQCGYCTPGFVMTMYSLLQRNPYPTQEEIEAEFDGNICRCTGFRSILDAMKSFAKDADPKLKKKCEDIEDLKLCHNICDKSGKDCAKSCGRYQADGSAESRHKDDDSCQRLLVPRRILMEKSVKNSVTWSRPTTLSELTEEVRRNVLKGLNRIRFVVGNTSTGVFKNDGPYDAYIDTKLVSDLYKVSDTDAVLTIGANVSLNQLIVELESRSMQSIVFMVMAKHIKKIANMPIRNVGCWAGNLSVKRLHPAFPSDVFTLFEAFRVKLTIRDCVSGTDDEYDLIGNGGFISLNMTGKLVISAKIPKLKPAEGAVLKPLSYKVMPRSQNAHAYVNAAFCASVRKNKILSAAIVYGGVSKTFFHATKTENYLKGKIIDSQKVLNGALKILQAEVKPEIYSAVDSSLAYRKSLALGLFYKFYVSLCVNPSPKVASAVEIIERPLSTGTQSYDSKQSMYPITEPMPKLSAIKQASGEAKYITDFSPTSDELFATIVTSSVANADIDKINSSVAKKLPGFHSIITAADLPKEVTNSFMPPPYFSQVIIAEKHVDFAGQPVAIVLADSQDHADAIAKAVVVTYKNRKPIVCDMAQAIEKGMFFNGAGKPVIIGDATTAIKNAAHKVSGRINIGSQYHFYMETQVTRAIPTEDGFRLESATQWQDNVQASLANIFGWDCNRINIVTPRIGGAYGGKAMNSLITAAVATLASYMSGKPVRFHVNLNHCMETYGCRSAYIADYTVGFDSTGKLQGIDIKYYSNSGVSANDSDVTTSGLQEFADNAYHCPNWKLTPQWVRTDIASSTWLRAPVSSQLTAIIEVVLEHVAKSINKDPIAVKQENLYVTDQLNLYGDPLTYCKIRPLSQSLLSSAKVTQRQAAISLFNSRNKWKKRGLAFTPMKFGITYNDLYYSLQASIFHTDGSVILSSAGIEVGQGINTKLIQVASYTLGAPIDLIRVQESTLFTTPNSIATEASLTSELNCKGILECCKILKARLDAAKVKLKLADDITWKDLIAKCYTDGVDFTTTNWVFNKIPKNTQYSIYGATVSEVELDIITGEHVIRKVDILYDCGQSINPEIDVGQAEGAFVMGLGYFTSEKMIFDPSNGRLVTNGTWEYKPPVSKDIPTEWNITFLKNAPNPSGILGSKAVGEPPLCTSPSVVFAIKRCVEDFKSDKSYFPVEFPATVDTIQQWCGITTSDYKI